jgi:uncharacterized protein (TIGR02145 family)
LNVSKYSDGTPIPQVTDPTQWANLTTGAWCYYNNTTANGTTYGKLYNWYTTLGDTLCPKGWHVPSDNEWTILTDYLGGESVAGGKMKSVGTAYWNSPNTGATNESGFTGLPGGYRSNGGQFFDVGGRGYWWSSTQFNQQQAAAEQAFNDNPKRQTYVEVQRYITLGALIEFINKKLITKITGAANKAEIICNDSMQFSNYYPSLTSCNPKEVLLLPNNSNLTQNAGGMNVYGDNILKMYPNVVNTMANYSNDSNVKQWPGITFNNNDTTVICPSRIFLNIEMIQEILNTLS